MDAIMPYLLNTILGAGGGWLGNMLKKNGLGMIGNLVADHSKPVFLEHVSKPATAGAKNGVQ